MPGNLCLNPLFPQLPADLRSKLGPLILNNFSFLFLIFFLKKLELFLRSHPIIVLKIAIS